MAVATASEKHFSSFKVQAFDHDPDATGPVDVSFVDLQEFLGFQVYFIRTIGTGNVVSFTILANPESDGSGADVEIKANALVAQPDAIGDLLVLECTAEEISGAGSNLRFVTANVDFATGTDEAVIIYSRGPAAFAGAGLTADVVS